MPECCLFYCWLLKDRRANECGPWPRRGTFPCLAGDVCGVLTGVLNSRRVALGSKVDWAYAPAEVKVLTSSDGANFEEARCWQSSTRVEALLKEARRFGGQELRLAFLVLLSSQVGWETAWDCGDCNLAVVWTFAWKGYLPMFDSTVSRFALSFELQKEARHFGGQELGLAFLVLLSLQVG